VPRIERTAEITWHGNLARGQGLISAASSGAFSGLPFSNATRIGQPEGKTSPEELLAAAHGGCFSTSLAGELTTLGVPPAWLEVSCRIVMDEVAGQGHQIVASHLSVRASVPGAGEEMFAEAVAKGDEGCPYSALLKRAGAEVEVAAELVRD
jgi:osmotically inducible protein OsmC